MGTYLTRTNLIKPHKRKRLREHRPRQTLLPQRQRNNHHRQQKLRDEGQRLERKTRGGAARGGEVEEGGVGGEVMAVVDAGEVVEVGVLGEGEAVEDVHGDIEGAEGGQGDEGEVDAGWSKEVEDLREEILLFPFPSLPRSCTRTRRVRGPIHPPENSNPINKRINLKMHAQPQNDTRNRNPLTQHRPHQTHNQHPQQPLRAPPGTDIRNHRVQQPDSCILERTGLAHPIRAHQDSSDEPPGHDIRQREQRLSKGEEARHVPCRREEEPGEQGRVAVCVARVGGGPARDVPRCVGEDEVVDVGVFDGGVGVLPGAVD